MIGVIYSLCVWVTCIFLTLLMGSATLVYSAFSSSETVHRFSAVWSRIICAVSGVKVEIRGRENIDCNGPQIFLSNHQGFFDIFAISGYFNVPFIWLAKRGLFFIPVVGAAMSRAGYIPVDRSKPLSSALALKRAIKMLKGGKSIVVFPEGTRTVDGSISRFKKGSLFLAIKSRVPVVPVTIVGSFEVMRKGSMVVRPGRIIVEVGKPISTESLDSKGEGAFLENIYRLIETSLAGLQKNLAAPRKPRGADKKHGGNLT